ncbi:MAG TPA: transcriptional repressor [Candidatus Eremiobacteraceae bacterium]|nr:transcriptional repressor [Candidatus Eremiobacteraceae bacterium]
MKTASAEALAAVSEKFSGTPHRMTKQRRAIVRQFAALRKYVTAKQLHAKLQAVDSGIGLATVYRTLEALRALGLVTVMQLQGEAAYLFCADTHHHHAVCTHCGRVDDVPCRTLPQLERMLSQGLRFRLTEHQMEFFGVCARCS